MMRQNNFPLFLRSLRSFAAIPKFVCGTGHVCSEPRFEHPFRHASRHQQAWCCRSARPPTKVDAVDLVDGVDLVAASEFPLALIH